MCILGIDWTTTDSRVWEIQHMESLNVDILPGVKMEFYQGVGRCSFYEVRSKFFKRIDILKEGFVKDV